MAGYRRNILWSRCARDRRGFCGASQWRFRRTTASLTAVAGQTASKSSSFCYQAVGVPHQVLEHGQDFGRQGHGLGTVPQASVGRVQREGPKVPERHGRWHAIPSLT